MTLTWPRARPAAARALIKAAPEDFVVEELAAVTPTGAGEHLYLHLQKTGVATPELARWLAHRYGVGEASVGYAGMKDKQAVTRQWFSVHTDAGPEGMGDRAGVRVLDATRHARKLRRGQLAGNRFRLRLRDLQGQGWSEALAELGRRGAPNYFGSQRFGVDNLTRAQAWLDGRRHGNRRGGARTFRAGLHLSVLRSYLFNEVLAVRVADGTWNRLLDGDVATTPGDGDGEPAPTGPLWGRGRSPTAGAAAAREQAALRPHRALCEGLEHAGVSQQRRSLVLKPADLEWRGDGRDLTLGFTLPPGGYATTLLGAVFELHTPGRCP